MTKRLFSILLLGCLALILLPTVLFAGNGEKAIQPATLNAGLPSFPAEDLVDPTLRFIPVKGYDGGWHPEKDGTLTAMDFFKPGKLPKNAKITGVSTTAAAPILDKVSVGANGVVNYHKNGITAEEPKTDTYTVTIEGDGYAPISAPLTVYQYNYADLRGGFDMSPWFYGDTRTWKFHVRNPGNNGVWSAIMREQGIFEICEEITDTTSEPGKSIYTLKARAIKKGKTFIDILYLSDTTASWSPWCYS